MNTNTPYDEQPRVCFADILQNLFIGFAIKQCNFQRVVVLIFGNCAADIKVRLIDLRQPGINHLFVKLFLFFKPEGARCALCKHINNRIEDDVVQIGVVDTDSLDLFVKRLSEAERGFQACERFGAPINPDEDIAGLLFNRFQVPDDKRIGSDAPDDALTDTTEEAILDCAHAERAHNHHIVIAVLNVLHQFDEVFALWHFRFKRNVTFGALLLHHFKVGVRNELQPHRDEGIVDAALLFKLHLVLILLRQRVFHLLKAHVVHFRGVDVRTHQL